MFSGVKKNNDLMRKCLSPCLEHVKDFLPLLSYAEVLTLIFDIEHHKKILLLTHELSKTLQLPYILQNITCSLLISTFTISHNC